MSFRKAQSGDLGRLFDIWRDAVEATHHFLSAEDRAEIAVIVKNDYLPNAEFDVYVDASGKPLGFMGCTGNNVDALFVDPKCHRQGIGRQFIDRVKAEYDEVTVQVNEQQPQAHAFYRSCGFKDMRRDPVDDAGRPFPTVHMLWQR
ncbi:acetyltransferase [Kordiimonas gwangyangensis]|uniref:acetyltransferase n=1 Tax=Kordiimonas gwangyangensis TaxID=288022 RepID=UPI0003709051|nr:acetyltransferase [Kordiimonas gwangyangensis]